MRDHYYDTIEAERRGIPLPEVHFDTGPRARPDLMQIQLNAAKKAQGPISSLRNKAIDLYYTTQWALTGKYQGGTQWDAVQK